MRTETEDRSASSELTPNQTGWSLIAAAGLALVVTGMLVPVALAHVAIGIAIGLAFAAGIALL